MLSNRGQRESNALAKEIKDLSDQYRYISERLFNIYAAHNKLIKNEKRYFKKIDLDN